eukprot:SAG11_NODE_4887_length_1733_cov_1.990208_2_plen_319_part_01
MNHEGATDLQHKKCEVCKVKRPLYATLPSSDPDPSDVTRKPSKSLFGVAPRWCRLCAKASGLPVVNVQDKKCEDCGLKFPGFGLPSESKKRWCGTCAKAHDGAVYYKSWPGINSRVNRATAVQQSAAIPDGRIESRIAPPTTSAAAPIDQLPQLPPQLPPLAGTPAVPVGTAIAGPGVAPLSHCPRCAGGHVKHADDCPKQIARMRSLLATGGRSKICEDCGRKRPTYALQTERRLRWCNDCAKKQVVRGADGNWVRAPIVNLKSRRCSDCNITSPCYGLPPTTPGAKVVALWCARCAKSGAHPTAISACRERLCEDCG